MDKKVNLELLKKIRAQSLAGFSLCKEALLENNNDIEKALKWLKIKGITKGMAKMNRCANEGFCETIVKKNQAIIFSLNCETDFVTQNDLFKSFYQIIKQILSISLFKNKEQFYNFIFKGQTIKNHLLELSGKIGEKIDVNNYIYLEKKDDQFFSFYNHSNKKNCSLLLLSSSIDDQMSENLAMQVVAMHPRFISFETIDQKFKEKELEIITKQINDIHHDKSLEMRQRIIKNKLQKQLCEIILLEQKFIRDNKKIIKDLLKERKINVLKMYDMEVGK